MIGLSFTDKVTVGVALLGAAAGVAGSFAVLRRRSLVGDMLAHASLPGVCLAYIIFQSRNLVTLSLGALVSGLAAVALMTLVTRWTRTKEDAAIGIMLSGFFGLGVVLLSAITRSSLGGNSSGLNSYIFGDPGNMLDSDLVLLALVNVIVLAVVLALFKEFKLVAFDLEFGRSQGWPTTWLELGMMAAVAVVTIVGLPIVGVILMAALVILPGATARLWTNRLHTLLVLAGVSGATTGALGVTLSVKMGGRNPAGAIIVLTGAAFFVLSILVAPQRGVIARLVSETRLRLRVAREHLLRSLYELNEPYLPAIQPTPFDHLREHRHWRPWMLRWLLNQGERRGWLNWDGQQVELTGLGLRHAAEAAKTHRMWELYMMEFAGLAPDHVDRSADDVEHLLPESLLVKLEERLAREGRMPAVAIEVPASPHEIVEAEAK